MPVEFLGMGGTNDGSETRPRSGPSFDREYTIRLARAHEDNGWDRVLTAYGSGSPDPAQAAAFIASRRGEPLADTAQQIESIKAQSAAAGRRQPPKFQVAFRPILGPTEAKAWEKAHAVVEAIARRKQAGSPLLGRRYTGTPQNTG